MYTETGTATEIKIPRRRIIKKKGKAPKRPEYDRTIHAVLRKMKSSGLTVKEICKKTWVNERTVKNWVSGQTKYPRHLTLEAVARVLNMEFVLVDKDASRH